MKNILIVSSTEIEIAPLLTLISKYKTADDDRIYFIGKNVIEILVCGIGIPSTTYYLTKTIYTKKYDLIINVGISGCFSKSIQLGTVFNIKSDIFADIGFENKEGFETLFGSKFIDKNSFPFTNGLLVNNLQLFTNLKSASAITVNTTSGTNKTINYRKQIFNVDTESMEGAAFFYVCFMEKIDCVQIRSISNYIEEKDTSKWDIPLATKNLAFELMNFLTQFQ